MRKELLVNGEVYHICTKSIAGYRVFNNNDEYERMSELIKYYQTENELRLSYFIKLKLVQAEGFYNALNVISKDKEQLVQIIAYCFMPTHIHFILRQLSKKGISDYMRKILDSYTRYFNTKHGRKGPLWEGRFKSILVQNNEQLLHLTQYLHLNPVTAGLIDHPEDWEFSSYNEYLEKGNKAISICDFKDLLEIKPSQYRKFVNSQISYQKKLSKIKKLLID